jgi:hypothetical protein
MCQAASMLSLPLIIVKNFDTLHATAGTEIDLQDRAPSGSVSTILKQSIHDFSETLLSLPSLQDSTQNHLPTISMYHKESRTRVESGQIPRKCKSIQVKLLILGITNGRHSINHIKGKLNNHSISSQIVAK